MIYYIKYLEALNETFSLQKKQYTQRSAELKKEYKNGENRIRSRFQQKMEIVRSENRKLLEEIDKEATTLMDKSASTSLGRIGGSGLPGPSALHPARRLSDNDQNRGR